LSGSRWSVDNAIPTFSKLDGGTKVVPWPSHTALCSPSAIMMRRLSNGVVFSGEHPPERSEEG
jgi:hypothetical protein